MRNRVSSLIFPLIGVLAFLTLCSGCAKAEIFGAVVDQGQRPLDGVRINILNSSFTTRTGKVGKYRIDCLPGKFTVAFSKKGYATTRLDLNLEKRHSYPAETVILWKIPADPGIYVVDSGQYVPLRGVATSNIGTPAKALIVVKSLTNTPVALVSPRFVLFGADYAREKIILSRLQPVQPARARRFAAPMIGIWGPDGQPLAIKYEKIDPEANLAIVQPVASLAQGHYALHWGALYAENVGPGAAGQTTQVYDFEITAQPTE